MNMVFYDNTETRLNVVTAVLDKWNIPYKVKQTVKDIGIGLTTSYDVMLNVDYNFYRYLDEQIEKEITKRIHLERSFELDCQQGVSVGKSDTLQAFDEFLAQTIKQIDTQKLEAKPEKHSFISFLIKRK